MNKERLNNYRFLKTEIENLEKRLEKLRLKSIETDFVVGSNTEIPYQPKLFKIEGCKDNSSAIKRTEEILQRRKTKAISEKLEIEEWIASLFDTRLRLIFDMRYMQNKTWQQVSRNLGSRDASYARKIHDRYLEEINK